MNKFSFTVPEKPNLLIQSLIAEMFSHHPDIRRVMEQICELPGGSTLLLFLKEKQITGQQLWKLFKGPCGRRVGDLHILLLGFKVGFVLKEDFLIADKAMIDAIVNEMRKDAEASTQQRPSGTVEEGGNSSG